MHYEKFQIREITKAEAEGKIPYEKRAKWKTIYAKDTEGAIGKLMGWKKGEFEIEAIHPKNSIEKLRPKSIKLTAKI